MLRPVKMAMNESAKPLLPTGSTYPSEVAPKEYIARFHAHAFQPAYNPSPYDQLAPSFTQTSNHAPDAPFMNGWFGPLYGVDVRAVQAGGVGCPYRPMPGFKSCTSQFKESPTCAECYQ